MKPFIKRIICLILIVPILNINWTETSFAKAPKVLNFGTQKEYYSIDFESYHYQFRKLYGRSFRLPYKKYMEKKYKIYFSDPNLSVKNIKSSKFDCGNLLHVLFFPPINLTFCIFTLLGFSGISKFIKSLQKFPKFS